MGAVELEVLRGRAEAYARDTPDPAHRAQVTLWLKEHDEAALREAFEPPLRFGTAGVRAPLGPGDARINAVTVGRLVVALCEHLHGLDSSHAAAGLCIGFDGRHGSAAFAAEAKRVATAAGFRVRAFATPVPTPLLAHAVRRHGAAAGVMITASHNPASDNGVKVFWQGGSQLLPPHDEAIATGMLRRPAFVARAQRGASETLGATDLEAYLEAICAALPAPPPGAPLPRITYSAMCGVGAPATRALLARLGGVEADEVEGECEPDPEFSPLPSPNPEHPRALDRGLAQAARHGSDLLVAHDPDADRLAVAVPHGEGFERLTGDEVGCLLGDYLLSCTPPGDVPAALVTTLVSSELSTALSHARGARVSRVPTGLKWIVQEGRALERQGKARFLFGYEEALGYCLPSVADDKDGLAALALWVRCWQHHSSLGGGLLAARDALFAEHGVHRTAQRTWRLDAPTRGAQIIDAVRSAPPAELAGAARPNVERDSRAPELCCVRYSREGLALRVALRPSGTEPKLKAYLEARLPPDAENVARDVARADGWLTEASDALDEHVRAVVAR